MDSLKKAFLKEFLITSLPVVLQQLLQNSLSFIDTLMIGKLGEYEIAAVGIGNQIYFLVSVVIFGFASGAGIFTSQFWGSKNTGGMKKTVGLALSLGLIVSFVFSVLSIFFPTLIIKIFVDDKTVISLGCDYLKWVGISYLFVCVSQVISSALRSCGDTRKPMIVTFFSMISDVILNYILIFSMSLGVKGAAIATAISRLFEMVVLVVIFRRKKEINARLPELFSFDLSFIKTFVKTAFPVILDDTSWAFGITVYKVVFARMGVDVLACANVTESLQNLFFTVQNGIGAGAAIIIGNEIGRKNYESAKKEGIFCQKLGLIAGIASGLLMVLVTPLIPGMFNVSETVRHMILLSLYVLSCTLPVKFVNHLNVCGIGRSGGDTKAIMIIEFISIWAVGVPSAAIFGLVVGLPIWWLYAVVTSEEITKAIIYIPRIKSGKWINDLVN